MGADLYLRSVHKKAYDENEPKFQEAVKKRNALGPDSPGNEDAQKEVIKFHNAMYGSGYFRDSYNGTSFLAAMGLSWWRDIADQYDEKDPFKQTKHLLRLLQTTPPPEVNEAYLKENRCKVDEKNTVADWNKMFADAHAECMALCEQAIELNEPLEMSL